MVIISLSLQLPAGYLTAYEYMSPGKHPAQEQKGRLQTMSNEKKYTQEEMKAIVDGILRKSNLSPTREISMDEMGHVAGGRTLPKTHQEIDDKWDAVESTRDHFGMAVASILAHDLGLIDSAVYENDITRFTIPVLRQAMHDVLDGKSVDLTT